MSESLKMSRDLQIEDGSAQNNSSEEELSSVSPLTKEKLELMVIRAFDRLIKPIMEDLIRGVVKEQIDLALEKPSTSMKRNSENGIQVFESRSLQLQFVDRVSPTILTGEEIKGEGFTNIKVALVDRCTGQVVKSVPEASAKVEIVVLKGDFDGGEGDNWTLEDFDKNIIREREGNKSLLAGNVYLNLNAGIGFVVNIKFRHDSSWMKCSEFRLGARVVDNFNGTRVKEAKTYSFTVRDRRSELYKKHHPPSLSDDVWRLDNIGKDGAFHKRLSEENINTVKDFLTLLFINPQRLQDILRAGAKLWQDTVDHAQTCVIDKRVHLYYYRSSQQKSGVVFNVVGQVLGLLLECQYVPKDKLSETEKIDAHKWVVSAFEHWEAVLSFDDETSLSNAFNPSNSPRLESPRGHNFETLEMIDEYNHTLPSTSSEVIISSVNSIGGISSVDDSGLLSSDNVGFRYDQPLSVPGQGLNSPFCDLESIQDIFVADELLQFLNDDISFQSEDPGVEGHANQQIPAAGFLLVSAQADAFAQRRWTKLFSVLKWLFAIKRIVVRKRIVALEGIHVPKKLRKDLLQSQLHI